ncbi:Gp19/Gp15/Gp42 family protein [Saccharopolyspora aridisoli]|uniref:Gp19/Gp15/Gp42 family protein n=1 Tax=Saccharopolyspora aridisoli TaxID=2530385 RepID=UPI001404D3BD|nr:Gp19/Gp15/Gp42 family protein [Saccharopolyspora aridisoli]
MALRLGRDLDEAEVPQVAALLSDAETLILTRLPDLYARIEHGLLATEVVVLVEATAVIRVLRNPEGIRSQTADAYSVSYDTRAASGKLDLAPQEWRLLGVRTGLSVLRPFLPPAAWW